MLLNYLTYWKNEAINILYPQNCMLCHNPLTECEVKICMLCLYKLPNPLQNHEYENMLSFPKEVVHIHNLWSLQENNIVQVLIHQLKYKYNVKLGIYLGHFWGIKIQENKRLSLWIKANNPLFVALPLHVRAQRKRGYNQSQLLIEGIRKKILSIQCASLHTKRIKNTQSQTQLSAKKRIINIQGAFSIVPNVFKDKNVIIIDDIMTTGATTHELVSLFIKHGIKKISIFTLIKS